MRNFSIAQGRVTLKWIIQSSWNLNSSEILRLSWITATLVKFQSKMTQTKWPHHFPHYKSMGAFGCHVNCSFDPICPKTFSPPHWFYTYNLTKTGQLVLDIFMFESLSIPSSTANAALHLILNNPLTIWEIHSKFGRDVAMLFAKITSEGQSWELICSQENASSLTQGWL